MPYGTVVADVIQNTTGYSLGAGNASIIKNRIINGAMVIDQRNGGSAITTNGGYPVDRFVVFNGVSGASLSTQRSTTAPTGFINSLYVTCTTAGTLNAGAYGGIRHSIEGLNCTDLGWGTANAKTVTLSFWVYASLTGNYGVVLRNDAGTYGYVAQYTVNAANTWQQITLTIAGPTAGTWLTTNAIGIQLIFDIGAGSTYSQSAGSWISSANEILGLTGGVKLLTNLNATLYITGVQLEVGASATGFEYRQYGQELANCQRYCFQMNSGQSGSTNVKFGLGTNAGTTESWAVIHFPVQLRTYPTLTVTSTASNYGVFQNGDIACNAVPFINVNSSPNVGQVIFTVASGLSANGCSMIQTNGNNTAYLRFNAEL
jgi:hypothetical protein